MMRLTLGNYSWFFVLFMLLTIVACDPEDENPGTTFPAISVEDFTITEGNEDGFLFVRLVLDKTSESVITARISSENGSAEAGSDFVGFANETVELQPGSLTGEYRMTIKGDEEPELDENFVVRIVSVEGATIANAAATITIENDEANSGEFTIPTGYSSPESYAGMSLVWQDEFSGTSIDESNWNFEIGNGQWGWGNNELQYYRKENAQIYDGHLIITANNENFNGFGYTSTRMTTQNKFDFKYGRVDIRANLPYGQGIWPALWMLGSNFNTAGWPACGEIDIMELVGHQASKVYGTAHWRSGNGEHASHSGNRDLSSGIFNDEFHVFSIVWDESTIKWYLDDQQYHALSITDATLSEFQDEFFFIFNVAVGGLWPGSPNASTTFPQHMIVDYIRVFQ